jgi:hypothetical protein
MRRFIEGRETEKNLPAQRRERLERTLAPPLRFLAEEGEGRVLGDAPAS